jgi:C4-dicarboxylate-specific signal transduction histidine kinase
MSGAGCGMSLAAERIESGADQQRSAEYLEAEVRKVLDHAVDAERGGLKVYQSLQNLNEVIGTEYGDRVLYELIQNAHDAHKSGERGRIAIRLVISSDTEGVLHIANDGTGFRKEDVEPRIQEYRSPHQRCPDILPTRC